MQYSENVLMQVANFTKETLETYNTILRTIDFMMIRMIGSTMLRMIGSMMLRMICPGLSTQQHSYDNNSV